jgi:hypothetical protein
MDFSGGLCSHQTPGSRMQHAAETRGKLYFWMIDRSRVSLSAAMIACDVFASDGGNLSTTSSVFGEANVRGILKAYASYYDEVRTHLSFDKRCSVFSSVHSLCFKRRIAYPGTTEATAVSARAAGGMSTEAP